MKKIPYFVLVASLLFAQLPVGAEENSEQVIYETYVSDLDQPVSEPSVAPSDSSVETPPSDLDPEPSSSSESSTSQSKPAESTSKKSSNSNNSSDSDTKPSSKLADIPTPKQKEEEAGLKEKEAKKDDEEPTFTVSVNYTTQTFIKLIGEDARAIGQEHKIYASVMIAQAILESGSGNSGLAQAPYYNLFGIKGAYEGKSVSLPTQEDDGTGKLYTIKADFRKYPNYKASLGDYAQLIRTDLYSDVWKENAPTYRDATKALTGKYATDTSYNKKLNAIIEAYDLTRYDSATDQSILERYPDGDYPDFDGGDYPGSENYTETSARYAFNRMSQLGGKLETNFGEPTNWVNSASQQGYEVSQTPQVGTVVVLAPGQEKAGEQGQVAVVEKLYPSGAILISEYGKFSKRLVSYRVIDSENAKNLQYITPKSMKEE